MSLIECINSVEENMNVFMTTIRKSRRLFKYFVIHNKFLPIDIIREHIFPCVFEEDYKFCKFLEEFDIDKDYRFYANERNYQVLKKSICNCIYGPELNIPFKQLSYERTMHYDIDLKKDTYKEIIRHSENSIYEFMEKARFMYYTYSYVKGIFKEHYSMLKTKKDELELMMIQQKDNCRFLDTYNSSFIIISIRYIKNNFYISDRIYFYLKFYSNRSEKIKVSWAVSQNSSEPGGKLRLSLSETFNDKTELINKGNIFKVINPKDIQEDKIIDGYVSIDVLDGM